MMNIAELSLMQQMIFVLAALVLLSSFALLFQSRLTASIHSFAWQGGLIALITGFVAAVNDTWHLYISALLTLSLKALLIPWLLHRQVRKLKMERDIDYITYPTLSMLGGIVLVIFAYWAVLPIEKLDLTATRNIVAISLCVVLLGLWMMIVRRQVVAQVLGFMSMENGLFLAAIGSTRGMPLVVELGIAFDVLVAAVLFGVFFFHINDSIDSLDVDRLNLLSEQQNQKEPSP